MLQHARFCAYPLKTVAMHKEQRNRYTDTHTLTRTQIVVYEVMELIIRITL